MITAFLPKQSRRSAKCVDQDSSPDKLRCSFLFTGINPKIILVVLIIKTPDGTLQGQAGRIKGW
ncbi:MAG: hypothetical protein WBV81_23710 [Ignavibacteriaceae bacterium]